MDLRNNNQILLIIFSFLGFILFNLVTQDTCVASYAMHTTPPPPQQQPVPPPQTDISAPTPAANPLDADISVSASYADPPGNDILAPTPAANSPEPEISVPTTTSNPPETDISASPPASNPPETEVSSPTQPPNPSSSQGDSNIFFRRPNYSEIKKICDQTDFPSLCWPHIGTFFAGKSDATSVLEMAINATAQQINLAHSALSQFTSHPNLPPNKLSTLLVDCKEMYDDALDNLKSARDAIAKHDISTVNIMLSAALTDFSTCNDEFTGKKSPVGDIDDKLNKLLSNCLAISSLIEK